MRLLADGRGYAWRVWDRVHSLQGAAGNGMMRAGGASLCFRPFSAERLPDPRFDAASLPFKPWSLPEMLNANQADLEAFLTHIYRAIASAAPLKVRKSRGTCALGCASMAVCAQVRMQ